MQPSSMIVKRKLQLCKKILTAKKEEKNKDIDLSLWGERYNETSIAKY